MPSDSDDIVVRRLLRRYCMPGVMLVYGDEGLGGVRAEDDDIIL